MASGHRAVLDFVREGAGGVALDATAGCQGHASGMSLCRKLWVMHAGSELTGLVAPILPRRRDVARDAHHRRLCVELPRAAESVYRYWRSREPAS